MITVNETIKSMINSPVRKITAKVELFEGSTLVDTFTYDGKLMNFTVERVCEEGKFFGFGICQHAKVQILDVNREVDYITTAHTMKISYGVEGDYVYAHPTFHITQSRRDENTNELVIYGYDLIYPSSAHTIAEMALEAPYSIQDVAAKAAEFLSATGLSIQRVGEAETSFATTYPTGANLGGSETIREVLDDVAEVTQTIYFVDSGDNLVFKRLSDAIEPDLAITRADYMELDTKDGRRISGICHATELGDNVSNMLEFSGTTQYVRDNAFWEMRDDIADLVDNALAAIGGLSIRQFECSWRGNFLAEPGDKIALTTKDNDIVISYLLDDTIEYNGALQEQTQWSYDDDGESESNPTSLGDVLRQTYARVDKANKEIAIVVDETASLKLTTDTIQASVSQLDTNMSDVVSQVNAKMSAEDVAISIQTALEDGVNKITTSTGFTFNEAGLHISRSDSEITTTITENGMKVLKKNEAVLTVDNEGVKAEDLHATTFLIIGTTSRFEDYDDGARTGCFWIGK